MLLRLLEFLSELDDLLTQFVFCVVSLSIRSTLHTDCEVKEIVYAESNGRTTDDVIVV